MPDPPLLNSFTGSSRDFLAREHNPDGTHALGQFLPVHYIVTVAGTTITAKNPAGTVAATGTDFGAVMTTVLASLASSAGNPVGRVVVGPGDFHYTTSVIVPPVPAVAGVAQAADPRGLRIEGAGEAARLINDAGQSTFFAKRGADYDTFGRVEITDFLFDNNFQAGFYANVGDYDGTSTARQRVNFERWTVRRCRMINTPTENSTTSGSGMVWISCHHPGAGETKCYLRTFTGEDLYAPDNGNFGVVFVATGGAATANVSVGDMRLSRCTHLCYRALLDGAQDLGNATLTVKIDPAIDKPPTNPTDLFPSSGQVQIPALGATSAYAVTYTGKTATTLTGCTSSGAGKTGPDGAGVGYPQTSNFQYVSKGFGARLVARDIVAGCSGDNSFEVDGCDFSLIDNYYGRDCFTYIFYQKSFQAPAHPNEQRVIYRNCQADYLDVALVGRGWGFAGTGFTTKCIDLDNCGLYVAGDYAFTTSGRAILLNLPSLDALNVNGFRGWWDTGGVASIFANADPSFFDLNPGTACRIKFDSPDLTFAGAVPTLNGHQYRPIGFALHSASSFDFEVCGSPRWTNLPGASANTRKGFIVVGYAAAATVRGSLRGLVVGSITNDTTPEIVDFEAGAVTDATHIFQIEGCDISAAPAATILVNATAAQKAFIRSRGNRWNTVPIPTTLTLTGSGTGTATALVYPVKAFVRPGTGTLVTAIDVSTNGGTTYTNFLTQAAAATPAGYSQCLGELTSDALVKGTYAGGTQPTIDLVPVDP